MRFLRSPGRRSGPCRGHGGVVVMGVLSAGDRREKRGSLDHPTRACKEAAEIGHHSCRSGGQSTLSAARGCRDTRCALRYNLLARAKFRQRGGEATARGLPLLGYCAPITTANLDNHPLALARSRIGKAFAHRANEISDRAILSRPWIFTLPALPPPPSSSRGFSSYVIIGRFERDASRGRLREGRFERDASRGTLRRAASNV
jgi:hypothetical protein